MKALNLYKDCVFNSKIQLMSHHQLNTNDFYWRSLFSIKHNVNVNQICPKCQNLSKTETNTDGWNPTELLFKHKNLNWFKVKRLNSNSHARRVLQSEFSSSSTLYGHAGPPDGCGERQSSCTGALWGGGATCHKAFRGQREERGWDRGRLVSGRVKRKRH